MTMTAGTPGGDMSTFRPPSKWADEQRGHRVGGEVHSVIDQIASPWLPRAADEGAGGSRVNAPGLGGFPTSSITDSQRSIGRRRVGE